MEEAFGFVFLLLVILFLWWNFFRQKPETPQSQRAKLRSTAQPSEKASLKKRTSEETKAEREHYEREREQDRLDDLEDRRQTMEDDRAKLDEEKRKIIEDAQRRMQEEDEGRRRLAARNAAKSKIGREFARYIGKPVPPEVKRSMLAFLAGEFVGSDRSPLAYVGYHVGKTNGLAVWDRERRLDVCFRIDIPTELRREYLSWAGPGSRERLNAMRKHIKMLAAMRKGRPGYEVAVSEWQRDAEWLKSKFGNLAETFSRHGVTWR